MPCRRPQTLPAKMKRFILLACFGSLLAGVAMAQKSPEPGLPTPRLYVVMPSGGRVGSTFEVSLTGIDIEEARGLIFSQPGIKAEPIIPPAPPALDPKRPSLPVLGATTVGLLGSPHGKGPLLAAYALISGLTAKPAPPVAAKKSPAKQAAPVVANFKVTIAADTPIGIHDIRLINKWGISNPRAFVVGDMAEILEKEPNNDVPQAQRVELNSTVSGTISAPTDVDYYVFAGTRGQRVVVSCLASSIDSRLRAALELYDSAGRQLGFNRHYQSNDALLDCILPDDGDYYVRLYEFTHTQGSAEHFYRLTISTAPWIDAVSPVVVEPGKTTPLTVYGRNLPGGQLDPTAVQDGCVLERAMVMVNVPNDGVALQRLAMNGWVPPNAAALDGFEFRLRNPSGTSNPFLLTYARAPVALSNNTNHSPAAAQPIVLPCEISGHFNKRRDRDWYTFTAKKGQVYSIEVLSDRLGAPNDMHFALRTSDAKQELANLDDDTEVLTAVKFYNRSDDPPVYRFVVPGDGQYQLMLASYGTETRAGPRHFYRVRITPESPDFHLIVMPSDGRLPDGCCLRQGGDEYYTILVWRHDGFNGPITLTVDGLPTRLTCTSQVVGPNLKQAALVVSAGASAPEWAGEIHVKGTALINGQTVVREARPASITWPVVDTQGIPAITRLDRNLVLAVRDRAPFSLTAAPDQTTVIAGSKINVALKLARLWPDFTAELPVAPVEAATHLPRGLTFGNSNQPVTIAAGKEDAPPVAIDVKATVPPGTYNVVLRGTVQVPFSKDPAAKQKGKVTVVLPANPITLTVLPNQVASLTVNSPNPTLKIGAQTELVIKVTRLHNYAGEFKVRLVLPADMKGISADDITIPAGKDEARLLLRAPADATPGNRPNLVVRAIAMLNGTTPLTHEAKINVNVVK